MLCRDEGSMLVLDAVETLSHHARVPLCGLWCGVVGPFIFVVLIWLKEVERDWRYVCSS